MPTAIDYLSTYLQDHRAGAESGVNLALRLRDENVDTQYEDVLTLLAREIEDDVTTLEAIMERLGVDKAPLKTAGAKVGEMLGRLKPNEHLTAYSPLSRVQELELLRAGVQGKLALWDALLEVSDDVEHLDPDELRTLRDRAESQLVRLREQHRMAAPQAFAA